VAGGTDYDREKLAELVLYIADRSISDARFGKTKLNKILFFSDFTAFRLHGRSITGAEYQHLPEGPCPHQLLPVLESLGTDIIETREQVGPYTQKRLIAMRKARVELFSGPEIAIVDAVISELAPLTNKQSSELSHETNAWRLTHDKQEVPYSMAVLSMEEPTAADIAWLTERSGRGRVEHVS